jgi:hypothetical protein
MKRILRTLTLALLFVAACSGPNSTGSVPPPDPGAYMLLPMVTAAGVLKLFDAGAPEDAPLTVDTGLPLPEHYSDGESALPSTSIVPIPAGSYDAATHSLSEAHVRYAWYLKDGTPYRVDLHPMASHAPVAFSSIDNACGGAAGLAVDYANPLNTRLLVFVPGADGVCDSSDSLRLVSLGSASNDPGLPLPVAGQVSAINAFVSIVDSVTAEDGSLQRLIVSDASGGAGAGALISYAPDLSSSKALASDLIGAGFGPPDPTRTVRYFVLCPNAAQACTLHRYDAETDELTPIYTYSRPNYFYAADETHVYFIEGAVARVAHDSTTVEVLHSPIAGVQDMRLTSNRIVLRLTSAGMNSIESLPKSGGAERDVLAAPQADPLVIVATSGEQVYYNRGTGPTSSAHRVHEDGVGAVNYAPARWGGIVLDPAFNLGPRPFIMAGREWPLRALLLARANGAGGVTLSAVGAGDGVEGPGLGTIDGTVKTLALGIGRHLLVNALIAREGAVEDFDVHAVDIETGASLRAVAATAELDDVAQDQ